MTRHTMPRAAIFHGPEQPLQLTDVDWPTLRTGELLVEITACTICGSDLHTLSGRRTVAVPTILGHEILGRIVAFGPDAPQQDYVGSTLHEGDRITWSIAASCGQCFYCRSDLPQKCEHLRKYGHEPVRPGDALSGGFATHCVLSPGTTILRLPVSLADAVACPANCATATIAAALEAAGDLRGRSVLLLGTGMLGLTAAAMARGRGAAVVIGCDANAERLARSQVFGVTHTTSPETAAETVTSAVGRYGVDVVLELSGSTAAFETAWPLVRIGGTVILVGSVFPSSPVPLGLEQIVRRQLTIRGVHNYAPRHLQQAVEFLQTAPQDDFAGLVSQWFALDDISHAIQTARDPHVFRAGIRAP